MAVRWRLPKLNLNQQLFWKRAFAARTLEEHRARSGTNELPKVLGGWDLIFIGIGSIVGAGVFVLSGVAANELAGPAVVVSYAIAGTAALLSALCYAEMAVSLPIAGGAFNYISVTFGELAAWTVAWNMCLEITLSSAAVARGFASYLATLLGLAPSALRLSVGAVQLDPAAVLLIAFLTAILVKGTKESSVFNMVVTVLNLASIIFVLCVGFPQAKVSNVTADFNPYGVRGVFSGAAVVFFAFIGFDYVANSAEEAKDPARDLPRGIVGSLTVATLLYVLMSLCICLMVPYKQIDVDAPFAAAFLTNGMPWAARVVSLGAVMGIVTSVMTGLLGQSRLLVVLGRERLLPARLSEVGERTGTPIYATLLTGSMAAALAFVLDIGVLAELVSIGTLYVFLTVNAGTLYNRFHQRGSGSSPLPVLAAVLGLVLTSLGFSLSFTFGASWVAVAVFLALFACIALSLKLLPIRHTPQRFQVPFFPFTPALGILFTMHLIGSLGWPAYVRFGVWMLAGCASYALYGVHGAEQREIEHNREVQARHALRSNRAQLSSPSAIRSLDREGYAGPIGSVELESGTHTYAAAHVQAERHQTQQQQRLMAGQQNSSSYDAAED